jgi:hypothetical protein
MRVKTSITLSEQTLRLVDRLAGKTSNRSRVIEQVVEAFAAAQARRARDERDLEILNRRGEALNRVMADVLAFLRDVCGGVSCTASGGRRALRSPLGSS